MKERLIKILEAKKISRSPGKMALILDGIDQTFLNIYDIFGLSYENEYKLETRVVLKQLANFFYNLGDPNIKISGDTIRQLTEIIDLTTPSEFYNSMNDQNEPKSRDTIIRHLVIAPLKYVIQKYNLKGSLSIQGNVINLGFSSVNDIKLDTNWLGALDKLSSNDIKLSLTHLSGGVISTSLLQEIDNYRSKILSIVLGPSNDALNYWNIENYLINKNYAHTPTRDFARDLLTSIGLGPQVKLASDFIFGDDDELPRKLRGGTNLRTHTLPSIVYQINTFGVDAFNRLYGSQLSNFELELIKEKLREDIQDYFSTGSITVYTDNIDKDTSEALLSIIYATSLHEDLHQQAGKQFYGLRGQITDKLGVSSKALLVIAKQGPSASEKLREIYTKISNWHQNEYGDRSSGLKNYDPSDLVSMEKLYAYQDAMLKIVNLGYDFNSPTLKTVKLFEAINSKSELIMNEYDKKYWTDKTSKAYINVYQLTKFLGIDPLTFRANPNNSPFDPHHFKTFPFRKMSTHTQDLIVTSKRFHSKYEALKNRMSWRAAQVYVETLIESLNELINLRDKSGALKKIEDKDVRQVLREKFGVSEWESVYQGWVSDFTKGMNNIDNYQDALNKINERRMKYIPGNSYGKSYRNFLSEEYRSVYDGHYRKHLLGNIVISIYVATQKDTDYFNLFFSGYSRVKLS